MDKVTDGSDSGSSSALTVPGSAGKVSSTRKQGELLFLFRLAALPPFPPEAQR